MFGFHKARRFESFRDSHPLLRRLRKVLGFLLVTAVLYELVCAFLLATYKIESVSMRPQYEPGNRILASPLPYGPEIPFSGEHLPGITRPRRGDVVILRPPYIDRPSPFEAILSPVVRFFTGQKKAVSFGERQVWENDVVIKRIIALPGDTLRMRGMEAYVRPKGTPDFVSEFSLSLSRYDVAKEPLPEGWRETDPLGGSLEELTLKDDEYFVLGDNRSLSTDSRLWGPVAANRIQAKVLLRYWPFGRNKRP